MEPATPQKTISESASKVTVFLLLMFYPVGLIVMWFWPKWKLWIKIGLTLIPVIFIGAGLIVLASLDSTLDDKLRPLRNCIDACKSDTENKLCVRTCEEKFIEDNTLGY